MTRQLAKVNSCDGKTFTVIYNDKHAPKIFWVYRDGFGVDGNRHKVLCEKFVNYGRAIDYIANRVVR